MYIRGYVKWSIVTCFAGLTAFIILKGIPTYIPYPNSPTSIFVIRKWARTWLPENWQAHQDIVSFILLGLTLFIAIMVRSKTSLQGAVICNLKGLRWDLNNFCRGWLITGVTGSGKTASAICHIVHQLFQNVTPENGLKPWGGVAVDQKGNFFKIIEDIAANYGQSDRLITLQVRPEHAPAEWTPKYRFNLLSYPGIPSSTYSKIIVDTAASLGQDTGGGSGAFFKTQAQIQIEKCIDLLNVFSAIEKHPELPKIKGWLGDSVETYDRFPKYVALDNVYNILTDKDLLNKALTLLDGIRKDPAFADLNCDEVYYHFKERYLNQPEEQLGGVVSTIQNYLGFFNSPDVCEVFCPEENSVEFEAVDDGVIFSISLPQRYQTERVYVNTLMKLIYYTHALKRFDQPEKLKSNNLLLFLADEAQGVVTASNQGMTDYSVIDKIREARATVLFAAQSTTSFLPVMKKEQVETLLLNLANQIHYSVADENCGKMVADKLGKEEKKKMSHGRSGGRTSFNVQTNDEYKIKPHILRTMKKFMCVIIHCEAGYKKTTLPPISPDGSVPAYFRTMKR